MVDGLKCRFTANPVQKYFKMDKYGSLIPIRDNLQMEKTLGLFGRQMSANTGLYRRLAEIYYRTDVEFTDNPYGNSPTIGAGFRMFGKRPLTGVDFEGRMSRLSVNSELENALDKRQRKIIANQEHIMSLHKELEPVASDESTKLLWDVEADQMMTGGGFDGNSIGEVHKSALNFIIKGSEQFDYADSQYSALVVQASTRIREHLVAAGLKLGSLAPQGAQEVRLAQESDGMVGFPMYAKALSPLTRDQATRLLIESGVDTRRFVGSTVVDVRTGETTKYRVVDALAYALDNSAIDASDAPSIVTLLARIQKHAWKEEDGKIVPSKPKTRSIYPNAARAGILEAMTINPFNEALKELKVDFLPSLQDKPTRTGMIKSMIEAAFKQEYDFLAADWSKWDATVKGHILATMIYYTVRPFYKAEYYDWVDFVIYSLTYKYLIMDTGLCEINNDMFTEAKSVSPNVAWKGWSLFGMVDGLISGAKFTHVGGSLYGMVVIHDVIPRLLGYEPIFGCQAGDDTLMGIPQSMIDLSSAEKTYAPIEAHAKAMGLDMNASKQIWQQAKGEVVKVFLQDSYHHNCDIYGVGSIFRPYDAVFFSEREKNLTIAEQLIAEISRMENGADSPFAEMVVSDWLDREQVLGVLFKEHGESAFQLIVDSIGDSLEEVAKRIEVGSFSFGISRDALQRGALKILPVMAHAAAKMQFNVNAPKALSMIGVSETEGMGQSDDLTSDEDVTLAD